jgi:hypothetical protein
VGFAGQLVSSAIWFPSSARENEEPAHDKHQRAGLKREPGAFMIVLGAHYLPFVFLYGMLSSGF